MSLAKHEVTSSRTSLAFTLSTVNTSIFRLLNKNSDYEPPREQKLHLVGEHTNVSVQPVHKPDDRPRIPEP